MIGRHAARFPDVDRGRRVGLGIGLGFGACLAADALLPVLAFGLPAERGVAAPAQSLPGALTEVAAGVFMVQGAPGEPSVANQGRTGNAGFIVGDDAVLAVDTGTSHAQGVDLLAAIATVTPKPVTRVVLTHARQEFIFGATAYRAQGIRTVMQRRAAQLMAMRCERCLRNLQRLLGEPVMHGTALVVPDELVDASRTLDLGGRRVEIVDHGHSAGPGDVTVTDQHSGVAFAGGLVDVRRIPDIQDADLPGWHAALRRLAQQPLRTVVPGHGAAAPAGAAIAATGTYLTALSARVQELLNDGAALSAVPSAAALPAYAGWDGYAHLHARNAAALYVRLEQAQLRSD